MVSMGGQQMLGKGPSKRRINGQVKLKRMGTKKQEQKEMMVFDLIWKEEEDKNKHEAHTEKIDRILKKKEV